MKTYVKRVLKLQRPIVTNESMQNILIYDKDRKFETTIELEQEQIDQLFGESLKQYWFAKVPMVGGNIQLIRRVKDRSW